MQRSPRFVGPVVRAAAVISLTVLAFGCAAPADLTTETPAGPPPGAIRGELLRYIITLEDREGMEQLFYLRTAPGVPEQRLHFSSFPRIEAGATVDVFGSPTADGLQVDRMVEVKPADSGLESQAHALISGEPLRPRRFAFVLVDLGGGVNVTKAEAERKLFGIAPGDNSVRQWFNEASYGRQDLGGQVIGPIKATMSGCNFIGLANTLKPQVPTGFDHYLWYFGSRVTACRFEGVALSGTPASPRRDTWYNAATDCVVLVQEPVHNFGTMHSSAMTCRNGQAFADNPMSTCVHREYGDTYDPMGRACRHMNGYQKAFQGWFGGCNVIDVNSTGTYTLLPLELPCDGPQVLQIKMPKTRSFYHEGGGGGPVTTDISHYYLEYRTSIGFDKSIKPMVQVRVSEDIRVRTQRGSNTWILDMNPATTAQDGLVAGGSYSDPAGGVKFTVMSMDGGKAVVQVETTVGSGGPATCLDGKPMPTPVPLTCAASPAVPVGQAPAPAVDAGAPSTPPGNPGETPPGTPDAGPGLVPVNYDAGISEGFKDAGVQPTPERIDPPAGAGGSKGSSGGAGGSGANNPPPTTEAGPTTGGLGCSVGSSRGSPGTLFGLLFAVLALVVTRRRAS